jgi:hypothetical protein
MKIFRKIFLWILVGLLSLGQLQRLDLPQFNGSIYLHDIFIIFWIFHICFTQPRIIYSTIFDFVKKQKKLQIFFILFSFSFFMSLLQTNDLIPLLYLTRLIIYIIFGFSLLILIKNKQYNSEYLKFQIFSIGLISLFLGFLQYLLIQDTRFLAILGWDDHYARLISTFFDPGFTGIIFLLSLLIGLSSQYLNNKFIKLFLIFIFTLGIILTFSRASYLASIIAFMVITFIKLKNIKLFWLKIIFSLLIFIFLIILVPKPVGEGVDLLRTSTIIARFSAIQQQFSDVTMKTIFIGNGPFALQNSINYPIDIENNILISHSRIPDNIFITVFLSTGIFGLILFLWILFDWAKILLNKNIYLFTGLIAVIVHSQFNNSLLHAFVLLILLGGIASATINQKTIS